MKPSLNTYIAYLSNRLSEGETKKVEQFVGNPQNRIEVEQLKSGWRLWNLDRLSETIIAFNGSFNEMESAVLNFSQLQPAEGWRPTTQALSQAELELPVPSIYNFTISLWINPNTTSNVDMDGEIMLKNGQPAEDLVNANVWLIPEADLAAGDRSEDIKHTTVDEFGSFIFPDMNEGLYRFELAWSDGKFYECPYIKVPSK